MAAETRLPAFLTDIGAAELRATPQADEPFFAGHRARLDEEIRAVQLRIHGCLQTQRAALDRQRDATASLSSRLETIQRDLRDVDGQLHDPQTGVRPTALAALERHAALERETAARQASTALLSHLQAVHRHIADLARLEAAGRLDAAVDVLVRAEAAFAGAPAWTAGAVAVKKLQWRLAEQRGALERRLLHLALVDGVAEADVRQRGTLRVRQSLRCGDVDLPLGSVLAAVDRVGLLEKRLRKLCAAVLEHLVVPALAGAALDAHDHAVALGPASGEDRIAPLTTLARFVAVALLPALPPRLRPLLTDELVAPICRRVVDDVLVAGLPASLSLNLLEAYNAVLARATAFEGDLAALGFEGVPPTISRWAADVGAHWAAGVSARVVGTIRALVVKAQWETAVVEARPAPSTRRKARSRKRTPGESADHSTASSRTGATASPTPAPPAVAAVAPATPTPRAAEAHPQTPAGGDEAWGFDAPPSPVVAPPVVAPQTSTPARAGPAALPETPGDDAWGFDEQAEASAGAASSGRARSASAASRVSAGDEWGFADASAAPESAQAIEPARVPQAIDVLAADADADGDWDFDEPDAAAAAAAEQPAPAANGDKAPSKPVHARADSLAGWDWEQDEAAPAAPAPPVSEPAPIAERKAGRGKLGAAKIVNGAKAVPVAASTPAPTLSKASPSVKKPTAAVATPVKPAERFTISTSSKQLLDISTGLLADAKKLHEVDFPHASFARAASAVQHCCVDALDYFRATMAVQHGELLATVPALGMQFANDCDWLARELADLDVGDDGGAAAAAGAFAALGRSTRAAQMAAQRALLDESLDEAAHFRSCAEPARFAACERSLRQVVHTLERLAAVWRPPSLAPSLFGALMGELVNGVLARVLREVEDQDDISEADSKRLNELCKLLHGLEGIFAAAGDHAVHVPLWFKFVFLSELLEASLVDIMFLFDEGHLVDFTADELVKLVRALFADSDNRAKAIDTIRAGRPQRNEHDDV